MEYATIINLITKMIKKTYLVFGAIILGLIAFYKGKKSNNNEIKTLKKAVDKLDETSKMDDVDICVELGGVRNECKKLRSNSKRSSHKQSCRINKK